MSDPVDQSADPLDAVQAQQSTKDTFRLRPPPPRVVRLSRKVLAGLGLVAGLGIGAALILALQDRRPGQAPAELFTTENRPTADALRSLPADYAAIPQLGPALPGDLGGPILRAREEGRPVPAAPMPGPDPAEQQRLEEEEAARVSALFVGSATRSPANAGLPSPNLGASTLADLGLGQSQEGQRAFLARPVDRRTVSDDRATPPASPFLLQAGTVIPAALVTGIRSDLPGLITAQVTQNVYDSPTGRFLLIPQGARLIGEYDDGIGFGQRRILLVWTRLILPGGRSIVLERQPGADTQGFAGLEDQVDNHWWSIARAAVLSTVLNVGAELAADDEDPILGAIRDGAQDTVGDASQRIVDRQLDVEPTLTIRPGFPVRVIVTRDLIIEPR
ncbi:MAG: conjugal transfer protein TraI [Hyphomonas sp.]|nr:conjugal transfer protein TraI [Hyphomonas sp.]